MLSVLLTPLVGSLINGVLRALLTAVGGFLVSKGLLNGAQTDQFLGVLVVLLGSAWSIAAKVVNTNSGTGPILPANLDTQKILDAIKAPAATALVLALGAGLLLNAPDVQAAPKTAPAASVWSAIQAADLNDLAYAKGKAEAAGTPSSKLRAACFQAWMDLLSHPSAGPAPHPARFARFEELAQAADAMAPSSPFVRDCTPVAQSMRRSLGSWVSLVSTGQITMANFSN